MESLMTRREAAAYMGISVSTIDRILKSGQMAYVQRIPNGKVWISLNAINEYIARVTRPAMPVPANRQTYRRQRGKTINKEKSI